MPERRYWLVKSEPSAYSFDDLMKEPGQTAEWDGVRNFQARNNMRDLMKKGDGVLFYHSGDEPAVVGTAVVAREAYPDHTAWTPGSVHPDPKSTPEHLVWYMVDLKAEARFARPVPLAVIKMTPGLQNMVLLKNPRLSVQPVSAEEWRIMVEMGTGK